MMSNVLENQQNQTTVKKKKNKYSYCSCPGSKDKVSYDYVYENDTSRKVIQKRSVVDFRLMANASKDSCDISVILNKLAYGDTSVLKETRPNLGDITNAPTNIHQVKQMADTAFDNSAETYNSMPDDLKKLFNGYSNFVLAVKNGTYQDVLSAYNESIKTTKESE